MIWSENIILMPGDTEELKLLKKIVKDEGCRRLLLILMRDIVSEVVNSQNLGSICKDLRPQNVLIVLDRKDSSLPLSTKLIHNGVKGCGTSDSVWDFPKWIHNEPKTRDTVLFHLGYVLHFCITRGQPILIDKRNNVDLNLLKDIPEAIDLIKPLPNREAELRPKAIEVLNHLMLWDSKKRLLFLSEVSNRVSKHLNLYRELQSTALAALGTKCDGRVVLTWDNKVDGKIIAHKPPFVKDYRFGSVCDLLCLIRNLLTHHGVLPEDIKEIIGPLYEEFDGYFTSLFPKLMIEVYKVVYTYRKEEECFRTYFKGSKTSISN